LPSAQSNYWPRKARPTPSSRQVYNILNGRYHNTDVAEAFISVVETEKERVNALQARATKATAA
jgi:hypothetical protein